MKSGLVLALVRAHTDGDNERFRSIVLTIAASADATSFKLAKSLRDLADRRPRMGQAVALLPLAPEVGSLLEMANPSTELSDMALAPETRASVDRVLAEQAARERLAEHGLKPARKLLFVGPPGVGKTMMASALAHELGIPMLRVQLHGVICSHLGETAQQLAKVFHNIRAMRGVYLFDEFDALSADRGSFSHDTGEMRRVVNSLLQFIEGDESESLIIGATNHDGVIDRAMFRRFDAVVEFPLPTPDVAERLVRARLLWVDGVDWQAVRRASVGVGHADLVAACGTVNKDAVLADRELIRTDDLVAAIASRRRPAQLRLAVG